MATPQLTSARALGRGPHTKHSAVSTRDIPARPDVVFRAIVDKVYKEAAGQHPCTVTVQGDPVTGEGCTRVVTGGVEEIVVTSVPNVKLEYVIVGGPLPFSTHKATVILDPLGNGSTRVTWSFDYTPSIPFLGDVAAFAVTNLVIERYLSYLVEECRPKPSKL